MQKNNPVGIIELGNLSIKCMLFTTLDNGLPKIISTSSIINEGIHNGIVVNPSIASKTIRSCLNEAEKKAKVSIKKANVILEQPEFLCTKFSKDRKIGGSKIQKEDIEFLLKEAKKQVILNDNRQSIIHIFNHNYIVDGKTFIDEPIDVYADYLSHEMTFVTMPKNNIKNIIQVFIDCDIEIERFISCTFAQSVKLLSKEKFKSGSFIIDLGHEKTSVGFFKNLALVHSFTFPIGTNHITKDISKVCLLSFKESEKIKNQIDFSFNNEPNIFDENEYLKKIFFTESNYRKISKSLILDVVKARINEIFEAIKKQIELTDFNAKMGTRGFIIGGGSNLINLQSVCSEILEMQIEKLNNSNDDFNSCLGALDILMYGWETEAIPEPVQKNTSKISFFSRIFGRKS